MTPAPETATGKLVRRQAKRGPAPSRWEKCSTCGGEGTTTDRFGRPVRCVRCRGRGRRKVDDYTNEEVAAESPFFSWREEFAYLLERDTKTATCPFCDGKGVYKFKRCEPCRGSGRIPIPGSWISDPQKPERSGGDAVDVQIDAFERRDELGDWLELERALVELRRRARTCYRMLRGVYMLEQRSIDELDAVDELALRAALLYLDAVLPFPIAVPRWIAKADERRREHLRTVKGRGADERALEARNREIERDLRQEKPVQWIADHYGLSVRQVYEIAAAMKARAQGKA
jgi:hypothetical protein